MNREKTKKILWRLLIIGVFAVAFALVEAAVVIYLRQLFGFDISYLPTEPKVLLNLGFISFLAPGSLILPDNFITRIELLREGATLVMLASLTLLSARKLKERLGAFLFAFSAWDIFYYVFLRLSVGWPKNLFDIDVFFLIPIPWVGPILTPVITFTVLGFLGIYLYINADK